MLFRVALYCSILLTAGCMKFSSDQDSQANAVENAPDRQPRAVEVNQAVAAENSAEQLTAGELNEAMPKARLPKDVYACFSKPTGHWKLPKLRPCRPGEKAGSSDPPRPGSF